MYQVYPQVQQGLWGLLVFIQILPVIMKVPIGFQLLINSTVITLIGVLKSVDIEKNDNDTSKGTETKRTDNADGEEQEEVLGVKDAAMFPVTASISLFTLYLLFTYVSKIIVKSLLKVYFSYLGMYVVSLYLAEKLIERDSSLNVVVYDRKFGFKIPYLMEEPLHIVLRKADQYGFVVGFVLASIYMITNLWIINNIFGIAFTIGAIRLIKLTNFQIGFIMLWGLFFYDIFWVFKTDVMVTVAKSIDGPILIKFPISFAENKYSMLGLGDMIVPGAFISLCLKYDVDKYLLQFKNSRISQIETPFMWLNISFYFIGILITYLCMVWFDHAQPALLYLVPAATIGFGLAALLDGNLKYILEYKAVEERPALAEFSKEETTPISQEEGIPKER